MPSFSRFELEMADFSILRCDAFVGAEDPDLQPRRSSIFLPFKCVPSVYTGQENRIGVSFKIYFLLFVVNSDAA